MKKDQEITDAEAAVLKRGKLPRKFLPKDEPTQLLVCRLAERGLMNIGSSIHNDNRCWTSFKGAYALAGWAAVRGGSSEEQGR